VKGRASDGAAPPDNRLTLLDQAFYSGHRAAGQREVMQVAWMYDRAIDLDQLKRFHRHLAYGLVGRRIERSPLPFGRHRWVCDQAPSELDIAEVARPRAELADWLDERSLLPIDPAVGPGWRLSVVPFTDGGAAVTLVISHYVVDGIGAVVGVALASMGDTSGLGYPPPHSRSRLRAVFHDAIDAAWEAPSVAKAIVAAGREARRRRDDTTRSSAPVTARLPKSVEHGNVCMPGVWIRIDMDAWNSRAEALGGTGSTLAVALTAKLDERMGRDHGDSDDVKMLLLVNDRTEGDLRAVAVSFAHLSIDPTGVTENLGDTRAAVKHGLKMLRETPDESAQLVPLIPFTPSNAWRKLVDYALSDPEHPAVCSNLGDTGPAVIRPDGAPCDSAFARGTSQHLSPQWLERAGSQLHLHYGTAVEINTVGIHVRAYEPGSLTTKSALHDLVSRTLAEFRLTGEID
jgi:hypothetical protein